MTTIKTIDAKTAREWLSRNEAILIDVREPGEYATAHVRKACLIPVGSIDKAKLPDIRNKKIIIHCQLGKRGQIACEKLLVEDPALDVYNLEGGIQAWVQAGYAVEDGHRNILALDRQVQITIGTGVLTGILLGYVVHPAFLLLAAFFGAGLLYAGMSGTCALATLLSKMPWNKQR